MKKVMKDVLIYCIVLDRSDGVVWNVDKIYYFEWFDVLDWNRREVLKNWMNDDKKKKKDGWIKGGVEIRKLFWIFLFDGLYESVWSCKEFIKIFGECY